MIFDVLANCRQYYGINQRFEKAFDFIKVATEGNLPAGKYDIDGEDVYAMVQEYTTQNEQECVFEGHKKYIDIQYMISGVEAVDVVTALRATATSVYDEEADVLFFEKRDAFINCVLKDGEYGIFFPNDVHKPCIAYCGRPKEVKKIVVKVKCS